MVRYLSIVMLAALCLALAPAAYGQNTSGDLFARDVRPFLKAYCFQCHGPEQQKGDRRFDSLQPQIRNDNDLSDLQDMLDQLNLAEMPPEDAPQPSVKVRRAATQWLTKEIANYHARRRDAGGMSRLRRLNAREYRHTVRDLLHLNMTMFDPTAGFPLDQTSEHLDNVGEVLVTSGHLLARYLTAAGTVVDRAMSPLQKPEVRTWRFRDGFRQQPEIDQVHRRTNGFGHITLYDVPGADKPEGAYAPIDGFRDGVPFDGFYEIRFRAEALNREHPYDQAFVGTDPAEPLRLGIVAGNRRVGDLHKSQPVEPLLAELELADEPRTYTVRVWLDAGYTPRFTFPNGLMDVRNMWGRLVRRYRSEFPQLKSAKPGIVEARFNAIKFGELPQIHVDDIEITGPIFEQWPTASQRAMFGDHAEHVVATGELPPTVLVPLLERFAAKAYRRKPTAREIERLLSVVRTRQAAGRTDVEAYADALKAALCSPGFLYLGGSSQSPLTGMDLAVRLSYFLWASTPDQELTDIALSGRLSRPDVLDAQLDRLLNDARSDAFIEGFLGSWLTLRDLGATPPDRGSFNAFYRYDLGKAMKRETHLFTRDLIDHNRSVTNFLDSDYTFADKSLARLYGIDPPKSPGFQRVSLQDRRRGGLLGQASVLTVTANGVDTSPVVRGVWLLENLLGDPPSPPPPDVEPLDPDTRGAKTIREQLKKHRSVSSCYDCHKEIDPLGFALENFDPIGRWRDSYGRRTRVDASGELPGGRRFQDVTGLKQILVDEKEQFVRALTVKLLAYGTGRHVSAVDRPAIDRIAAAVGERGYGLRDLIKLVAASDAFRR